MAGSTETTLTRVSVEGAFGDMGDLLRRAGVVGEIVVFGQAAIMLQYAEVAQTDDVDVRIDANHGAVEKAAHEVAKRRGWLRSWLNEEGTSYLPKRQSVKLFGTYPDALRTGLRVYVARPECLLALKLQACRSTDLGDAIILARDLQIGTPHALSEMFRSFYPDHQSEPPRDARRVGFIMQVSESVSNEH